MVIRYTQQLREEAYKLKLERRGPQVYFRGLIELSNKCRKNCLYCGIRCGNCGVERYEMSDEQVLREAQFALDAGYGSIAIQGGERSDSAFVERIARLVYAIRRLVPGGDPLRVVKDIQGGGAGCGAIDNADPSAGYGAIGSTGTGAGNCVSGRNSGMENNLGITLSLGEQEREVFREWKNAGASRYLLRIEASNRDLYEKLHPGFRYTGAGLGQDDARIHSYDRRVQALYDLKSEGYLLGSGIMIGLPFQTSANLDEDLQFLKDLQVDMVGMGPYIPHKDTPLGQIVAYWRNGADQQNAGIRTTPLPEYLHSLAALPRGDFWKFSNEQLLDLSLDMVAHLRILMPHINIAATTALQVLHPYGREMALLSGANVIMPNMTETSLRGNYSLYEGKHGVEDDAASTRSKLLENLSLLEIPVGWNLRGDWR